jgi:hypothetical protein
VEYKPLARLMRFYVSKMGSCREVFKTMEILPYYSQYIFSVLLYVVNNKHLFTKSFGIHNKDARSTSNFNLPITYVTKYQKRAQLKFLIFLPT